MGFVSDAISSITSPFINAIPEDLRAPIAIGALVASGGSSAEMSAEMMAGDAAVSSAAAATTAAEATALTPLEVASVGSFGPVASVVLPDAVATTAASGFTLSQLASGAASVNSIAAAANTGIKLLAGNTPSASTIPRAVNTPSITPNYPVTNTGQTNTGTSQAQAPVVIVNTGGDSANSSTKTDQKKLTASDWLAAASLAIMILEHK